MGDTTRFLSEISSPELNDQALNQPDEQLTSEQLQRKRRKARYREELLLRVYPDSIRRRLLTGGEAPLRPEQEADINAIVDAGLYVLAAIEEQKVAPQGGDEVRRLIQWKKNLLARDAARTRARTDGTVSLDALGKQEERGVEVQDTDVENDPALVVEVTEVCRAFMKRLTARQRTVVQLLIQGSEVADIAAKLDVTPRSIYGERDRIKVIWAAYAKDMKGDEFRCILDPLLDTIMEAPAT